MEYWDVAYDCVTFPVKVVWANYGIECSFVAFEVESDAPCLGSPERRPLRAVVPDWDPPPLSSILPLVTATVDRVWTTPSALPFEDNQESILSDRSKPLAFLSSAGPRRTRRSGTSSRPPGTPPATRW
jgi:hypothetical protein